MADPVLAQGLTLVFGAMLTALTCLMAWQALSVIAAGRNIAVLETLLKEISEDLKRIGHHDSLIAVLDNKVSNLNAKVDLCAAKVENLERGDKTPVHRR